MGCRRLPCAPSIHHRQDGAERKHTHTPCCSTRADANVHERVRLEFGVQNRQLRGKAVSRDDVWPRGREQRGD